MINAKRWGVIFCVINLLGVSMAFAYSPKLVMLAREKGTTFRVEAGRGNGSIQFSHYSGTTYTDNITLGPRVVLRTNDNYQFVDVYITPPKQATYVAKLRYSVTMGEMVCEVLNPKPDPARIDITVKPESCWILVKKLP